jgi:hypothetical protein
MAKIQTVQIDDTKYKIAPITEGQFEDVAELGSQDGKAFEANRLTVASCLNNADQGTRTPEDIKSLPRPDFEKLLVECLELSGLAKNKQAAVETTTPSTLSTSAAQ